MLPDDAEVEYVLSASDDKRVYEIRVQCDYPMTHEEFLQALQSYLLDELAVRQGEH